MYSLFISAWGRGSQAKTVTATLLYGGGRGAAAHLVEAGSEAQRETWPQRRHKSALTAPPFISISRIPSKE